MVNASQRTYMMDKQLWIYQTPVGAVTNEAYMAVASTAGPTRDDHEVHFVV